MNDTSDDLWGILTMFGSSLIATGRSLLYGGCSHVIDVVVLKAIFGNEICLKRKSHLCQATSQDMTIHALTTGASCFALQSN